MKFIIFYSIATLFLSSGCSSLSTREKPQTHQATTFSQQSNNDITKQLYRQFKQWEGVQHVYGGLDRSGIDCSGYVFLSFKKLFNVALPRTTEHQVKQGYKIKKSELRVGDLVFFYTGFTQRHVGIYLEQNKFVHVSSRRGVIISSLDNPYWKTNFWQARRIPINND